MLTANQARSVSYAQDYFEQVLTQGDYYLGQEIAGNWNGKGVSALGLSSDQPVTKEQFNDLVAGKHPITGQSLTQRQRSDRRPGVDLTFSVPKSVTLAWAINDDERIAEVLREAVHETMQRDVEPLMQRRVRTGDHANTKQKKSTGRILYADFLHKTSRPVDGKPDPHLHVHAFVVNWTQDNGKHYAGELEEIMRQRPSLQAKFDARLARKLKNDLGYGIEHVRFAQGGRLKNGWEISGVSRKTIEKFSRRTMQVEEYAKKHGVKDASEKAEIGKLIREKKDLGKSLADLRTEWKSRLSDDERRAFGGLNENSNRSKENDNDVYRSLNYSLEHHLYRQSTVERHQVIGTALEHGLTLRPEDVEKAFDKMDLINRTFDEEGTKRHLVTTRDILNTEREMIDFARDGRGTRKAIGSPSYKFDRDWLNEQQKNAVRYVLESRDNVMAITGGAGTGKTSLMQEATGAIRESGKRVFTFAPSTGAKEVLEDKGFSQTETVEHLIRNTRLHPELNNQVIWIDEAGLLDNRSMHAVFQIAKEQNARVILSGDTRQHGSPRRGQAMRLLEKEAGLNISRVEKIQRQKGEYREAVELISKGHEIVCEKTNRTGLLAGFDKLNLMGKIKEMSADNRLEKLATSYLAATEKGTSSLIVAPTHSEANSITDHIRDQLKAKKQLGETEHAYKQLASLNLTDAEKGDASVYQQQEGLIVQFHQNTKGGIKKGERFQVTGVKDGHVRMTCRKTMSTQTLPLDASTRFDVYREAELNIAVGDKVRFSLGGKAKNGTRISNGRLDEIRGIDRAGNLRLKSGAIIDRDYGHLDLGYVITSHASQGKDRQLAIAAMGSESLPAINAKQFYVTVSRGSENVEIYVDDIEKVRRAIARSGEELSATELIRAGVDEKAIQSSKEFTVQPSYQQAANHFRNRVSFWWNKQNGDRNISEPSAEEAVGRHRAEETAQSLTNDFSRGMDRGANHGECGKSL